MICEKCGKKHNGQYGSGRFCSISCSKSRKFSKKSCLKISNSLQGKSKRRTYIKCKNCNRLISKSNYNRHVKKCFNKKDDIKTEIHRCIFCNKKLNLNSAIGFHVKKHNLTFKKYIIKAFNIQLPKCSFCKKNKVKILTFNLITKEATFTKTCGSKECKSKERKNRKHSDETKEIMRIKRFEYLKKRTGKTAWERRNKGEMSYLEQWFFDEIIIKYNLFEKYDIINEYPIYPYFIDFAFLNIKLAVELDGKCHFSNGEERVAHDTKKDNFLISQGWKIFRIDYIEQKENTKNKIQEFLYILKNIENYCSKILDKKVFKYKEIKNIFKLKKDKKDKKIKRTRKQYREDEKKELEKFYDNYKSIILNSNIDFTKRGCINELSKLLKKSHTQVRRILKKCCPTLYIPRKSPYKGENNWT